MLAIPTWRSLITDTVQVPSGIMGPGSVKLLEPARQRSRAPEGSGRA